MAALKIREKQLKLLEKLCAACAVSGDEGEVRKIVRAELKPLEDQGSITCQVDALGNLLVTRPGLTDGKRLRVMLAAHMDEVGLMLTGEDGDGLYRFERIGGIDPRQLPGKPVLIGKDHIPGVIGAKPIHLTTADERSHSLSVDNLRVDIGPEAKKVKVGDRAAFATPLTRLGPSLRAKALDDRLGVAILIELIRNAPEQIDLLAAFTVQEENGLRGAQVASYAFDPDLAFVLDATPANDLPMWDGSENTRYNTRLDGGPAIYVADGNALHDPRLVRFLLETGDVLGIPYQVRQPGSGGTDAGAIHKQRSGIPSASISVPHRYSHTSASIARKADWEHTLQLLQGALERLTPELLSQPR